MTEPSMCACPGHPGCRHRPYWCLQPPGDKWAASHCTGCGQRRTTAITRGLRAMRDRTPQTDLEVR
jgi:hypothetical protein